MPRERRSNFLSAPVKHLHQASRGAFFAGVYAYPSRKPIAYRAASAGVKIATLFESSRKWIPSKGDRMKQVLPVCLLVGCTIASIAATRPAQKTSMEGSRANRSKTTIEGLVRD